MLDPGSADLLYMRAIVRSGSGDWEGVRADLDAGYVVVVAGFQGVDDAGNITTLARGGSDTTGVAHSQRSNRSRNRVIPALPGIQRRSPK